MPAVAGIRSYEDVRLVSSCQKAGHTWVHTAGQLAVQVPSGVIPEKFNILLKPTHANYGSLLWREPRPFRFDPRFFRSEPQNQ